MDMTPENPIQEIAPIDLPLIENLSLMAQIEAVVFASPKPVTLTELAEILGPQNSPKELEQILENLIETHQMRAGGFRLEYLKGFGYQFRSVAEAAPLMERMFATRPRPISRAALETLAIVAYRQPVTRADIEFVRGVDAGSIIKNLLERDLIACVGRKEDSGRPMLFGTTAEFLKVFRISSTEELPSLQSFQPSMETMNEALKQLDGPESVDIEQFVGDETAEEPVFSEGMSADVTSQDSEMVIPDGGSIAPGSGELDPSPQD